MYLILERYYDELEFYSTVKTDEEALEYINDKSNCYEVRWIGDNEPALKCYSIEITLDKEGYNTEIEQLDQYVNDGPYVGERKINIGGYYYNQLILRISVCCYDSKTVIDQMKLKLLHHSITDNFVDFNKKYAEAFSKIDVSDYVTGYEPSYTLSCIALTFDTIDAPDMPLTVEELRHLDTIKYNEFIEIN